MSLLFDAAVSVSLYALGSCLGYPQRLRRSPSRPRFFTAGWGGSFQPGFSLVALSAWMMISWVIARETT